MRGRLRCRNNGGCFRAGASSSGWFLGVRAAEWAAEWRLESAALKLGASGRNQHVQAAGALTRRSRQRPCRQATGFLGADARRAHTEGQASLQRHLCRLVAEFGACSACLGGPPGAPQPCRPRQGSHRHGQHGRVSAQPVTPFLVGSASRTSRRMHRARAASCGCSRARGRSQAGAPVAADAAARAAAQARRSAQACRRPPWTCRCTTCCSTARRCGAWTTAR